MSEMYFSFTYRNNSESISPESIFVETNASKIYCTKPDDLKFDNGIHCIIEIWKYNSNHSCFVIYADFNVNGNRPKVDIKWLSSCLKISYIIIAMQKNNFHRFGPNTW